METELPEETGAAGIRTDNVDMVIEPEPQSTKSISEMSPVQLGNKKKSDEQDIPKQEFRTYSPENYAKYWHLRKVNLNVTDNLFQKKIHVK